MELPKILQATLVASSRLFSIESLNLRFSNGVERTFERLPKREREAVIVCAITEQNEVLLIREYLAGIHRYELVLPKGRVDDEETFEVAANRELMEETGFGANSIKYIRELTIAPSHMGFSIHAMLATDLFPEKRIGDEPEPLEVVPCPMSDIDSLVLSENITEARSIATLKLAEILLKEIA